MSNIITLTETDSTNNVLKQMALEGAPSGTVVTADCQTAGKGRLGRSFASPAGKGIYLSYLMHPKAEAELISTITCWAAVATVNAISSVCGITPSIKWVNDIFLKDRKIAGILTETFGSLEEEFPEYVVVGVGINIYPFTDELPSDIKKRAGFLIKKADNTDNLKNLLCINFVKHFYTFLSEIDRKTFLDGYRMHSNLIGRYVRIHNDKKPSKKEYALVTGIDDECRLLVTYDDKKTAALTGKEVSVVKY